MDDQPTSGRFSGGVHLLPVRVYFEDTDLSGVVYHANYLRFLERARSDMLRLAGIDQRRAAEAGEGAFAVVALSIRYVRPARLDDVLLVESRPSAIGPVRTTIQHRVRRDQALLAQAEVEVAFVAPGGRPRRQPSAWVEAFGRAFKEGEEQTRWT